MNAQELAVAKQGSLTAVDIRKQVNLVQQVMKFVMKEDEHYGEIPGCKKPSLFKPGAEKLAMTFRLAPNYDELPGSLESDDHIIYKINCCLVHIPTGQIIGNGRGTCNSKEKKYRTRSVYKNKATEEEKEIGKLEKRAGYEIYIIPQDPWDIQNTIYKMACKRALIAAVLNATAASDIFTQDIEDLPEGTIVDVEVEPVKTKPEVAKPEPLPAKKETPPPKNGNVISEPQVRRLYAIARSKGHTDEDVHSFLEENYGITSAKDVERIWYEDVCAYLQTPKAKDE